MSTDTCLPWLLGGDPAIRWQARRDLLDEPPEAYASDRSRVATEGWGAQLLALQDPAGTWAGAIYSPKWTSTTYTLLLLRHLGLPPDNAPARRGCELLLLEEGFYRDGGINLFKKQSIDRRWQQGQNWPGRVFLQMEAAGQPSRWSTLRGLRVLRWWEGRS